MKLSFLEEPFFFNNIRRIIAGDQVNTKAFVEKWLKENSVKSIIDVGCGTGDFYNPNFQVPYIGIDLNKKYISFAKQKYKNQKNCQFLQKDFLKSSFFEKKKYDGIIFVSMMHHFSDDELEEVFKKLSSFKPKVIVVADIIPDPPGFLRKLMVKLDQGSYVRPKSEKLKILKRHFQILHTQTIQSRLAVQFGVVCKA